MFLSCEIFFGDWFPHFRSFYSCTSDTALEGPSQRTCLGNGSWTGTEPRCLKKKCVTLSSILHGFVLHSEDSDLVQFKCQPGFQIRGPESLSCFSNGSWSGQVPKCVRVSCPPPEQVGGGGKTLGKKNIGNYNYGDVVTHLCPGNKTLVGTRVRKCGSRGEWSGRSAVCSDVFCPDPPSIPHGRAVYPDNAALIPGTKARYYCRRSHHLMPNATHSLICTDSAEWKPLEVSGESLPTCAPTFCSIPLSGNLKILPRNGNPDAPAPIVGKFRAFEKVKLLCPASQVVHSIKCG